MLGSLLVGLLVHVKKLPSPNPYDVQCMFLRLFCVFYNFARGGNLKIKQTSGYSLTLASKQTTRLPYQPHCNALATTNNALASLWQAFYEQTVKFLKKIYKFAIFTCQPILYIKLFSFQFKNNKTRSTNIRCWAETMFKINTFQEMVKQCDVKDDILPKSRSNRVTRLQASQEV